MTKGVVTAVEGRDAEYRVRLEFNTDQAQKISDRLKQQLIDFVQPILDAEVALIELQNKIDSKAAQVDRAIIEAQIGGPSPPETEKVSKLLKELAVLNSEKISKQADVARLKLQKMIAAKAKTQIDNAMSADTFDAQAMFCADYTTDIQVGAEVGVCLIPGENTGATLTIYPAYEETASAEPAKAAKWTGEKFGQLTPPYSMTPEACFYNWAILPGWQRWMPTFRHATITAIDKNANTADVDVDEARSSVGKFVSGVGTRGLNVNETAVQPYRMEGVPIVYMECNCDAFEVGDRVIIEFTERIVREKLIVLDNGTDPPTAKTTERIDVPAWKKENSRIIGFVNGPKMCPIFVEHGYVRYDILTVDDPAEVYPTAPILSANSDNPPYLDAEINLNSPEARNYAGGMESISFPAGNESKIPLLAQANPVYATGLLRLATQSQYGAKGKNSSNNVDENLTVAIQSFPNTLAISRAIYKAGSDDNPEYWLLIITPGNVSAQQLTISKHHQDTLIKQIDDADDSKKIDAYILSIAKLGGESHNQSIDAVEGEPFAYGWNANSDGTELVMVTREAILGDVNIAYHTQRLYKLEISITRNAPTIDLLATDSYSLTASLRREEQVNCTPENGRTLVWYPNFILNKMETFNWHATSGYDGDPIEQDAAPMYAFYDADDKLNVFRHYLLPEEADAPSQGQIGQLQAAWEKEQLVCIDGSREGFKSWATSYSRSGFYVTVDGVGEPGDIHYKDGATYTDYEMDISEDGQTNSIEPSSPPGFGPSSSPPNCGDVVDDSWKNAGNKYPITVTGAGFSLYRKRTVGGAAIEGDSILVLPFAAEFAYIGTLVGASALVIVYDATKDIYNKVTSELTGAVNGSQFDVTGAGGGVGQGVGTGVITANSSLHNQLTYEQLFDVEFTGYAKHGPQEPVTLSVSSTDSSDQNTATVSARHKLGAWEGWFNPKINIDPTNSPNLYVQESTGGTIIFTSDPTGLSGEEIRITDDEIPDDVRPLNGLFVGWA